jgi:hypothetical protein
MTPEELLAKIYLLNNEIIERGKRKKEKSKLRKKGKMNIIKLGEEISDLKKIKEIEDWLIKNNDDGYHVLNLSSQDFGFEYRTIAYRTDIGNLCQGEWKESIIDSLTSLHKELVRLGEIK